MTDKIKNLKAWNRAFVKADKEVQIKREERKSKKKQHARFLV